MRSLAEGNLCLDRELWRTGFRFHFLREQGERTRSDCHYTQRCGRFVPESSDSEHGCRVMDHVTAAYRIYIEPERSLLLQRSNMLYLAYSLHCQSRKF